jgi:U3 small nucleolar RNA-associated protein 20
MLVHSHAFKVIHKCSECLRRVALGLADNSFVSVESLLVFLYGIVSESIPELVSGPKTQEITPAQKKLPPWERPDIFIIPPEPRNRSGPTITARTSARTNAHILVEFGLRLFRIILKREKLRTGDFRPFVDPMVSVLCDCLKGEHVKVRKQ